MSDGVVAIEFKQRDAAAAAGTLRAALLAAARLDVTPEQATALSGLPLDLSRDALFRLAAAYPARIHVDASGAAAFAFDSLETPRDMRWRKARERAIDWWARHGDMVVAIATILVLPLLCWSVTGNMGALLECLKPGGPLDGPLGSLVFVVLLPMLLAAFVIAGAAALLYFVPLLAVWGFGGLAWEAWHGTLKDPWGWLAMGTIGTAMTGGGLYAFVLGEDRAWARELWEVAGSLLFGPPPRRADALSDERRLVALIVARGGVIGMADLVALFGWSVAQAESELARVMVDYGGDFEVTEEGAILYRFDPLRLPAGELDLDADLAPAWEREADYPPFFGCPRWLACAFALATVLGLAGLALHPMLAFFPTPASWAALADTGKRDIYIIQGLGAWIYLAALLPIALRAPAWLLGKRRWPARRRFLALAAAAHERPDGVPAAGHAASDLVALGGEVVAGPDEAPHFAFPAFARARSAAERVRAGQA